jgi:tetrapyrrole methylase family protein/MazG family protein
VGQEGRKPKDSLLDAVSRSLPPLDRAYKLQKKAAHAGFDWTSVDAVIHKVEEELGEVKAVLDSGELEQNAALEGELGDLLFSVINLCRFLHIEPSVALQQTNVKFIKRFKHVEARMKETGQDMQQQNLGLMDQFWEEAKTSS